MALIKSKHYYQGDNDTSTEGNVNFDSFSVYAQGDDKVGSVKDALVDEQTGRFRYLIVDTGFWVFGKTVLLPIGLAHFDYDAERVYVNGLTKEQVENLPEFSDDMAIDSDYEEQVRGHYRPLASQRRDAQFLGQSYAPGTGTAGTAGMTGVGMAGAASMTGKTNPTNDNIDRRDAATRGNVNPAVAPTGAANQNLSDRRSASAYDYDREPGLYALNERENQRLRLYEERLIAQKQRAKVGEVAVNKRVETETAQASVPVERERVVIERNAPGQTTPATNHNFGSNEVAKMDVYEEQANIQKQAVVREEVDIHKEVDRDVVSAEEKLRREELDINTEGNPSIKRPNR
ncbi:DUF2382 domain-containing protein [Oculatella sp. LEGE 06141]|uniref:DUF2382 domain-containing protein n=1 Tax=Oculatella sp. LEGE 06141 TaxID=1828648 RepID=UPI00187F3373|nr:DUF2382 domain-containing protein [Oculatella sp. LEGE 06141]MBE9177213.1 DUF2382 domain-containing protein [Oculatella sp. LEGE 06141]